MSNDPQIPDPTPKANAVPRKADRDSGKKVLPKVTIPEIRESPKRGSKFAIPVWLWIGLGGLLLAGLIFLVIGFIRETKVTFHISPGDLTITEKPAIIYNFTGKVDLLRADYVRRIAPINFELKEVQSSLAAARADLAGKMEKKRMLNAEVERLGAQIPKYAEESQQALSGLFDKQGAVLDKEYAAKKEEYQKTLEDHAKELGVDYQRNTEFDSIDVSVNAFKLALYGAPKAVNAENERKYAEDLLVEWQKYQEEWQKRLLALKDESQNIRQQPGPKIKGIQEQVAAVKEDIETVDAEIASYQLEVRQYEVRNQELNEQVKVVGNQFMEDLLKTPKDFIKVRLDLAADGTAQLNGLEDHGDEYPSGDYFLLVTGLKDKEVYWALKKFTIREHAKQKVYVLRSDFVQASSYLKTSGKSGSAK